MPAQDPWTEILGFTDLGTDERKERKEQVKSLIRNLHKRHPDIFEDEPIDASDYQKEWKPAIFSLGGSFRQGHGADSEETVQREFLKPAQEAGLLTFENQSGDERIDFKGRLQQTGDVFSMDVKGGEGQSIGHLLVPTNTEVLVLWSERNARNTKSPSGRLNEVINRTVRWGFNRDEDVTMMVIRDESAGAQTDDGQIIPDVVVFPERFPTPSDPRPALPDLTDLHFAEVLYETAIGESDLFSDEVQKHVWLHEMHLEETPGGHTVQKNVYNSYDSSITLPTQGIDFERISDVG